MPIQSIGHAVLKVSNLERAEAFYCDVLGFPVATRWQLPGGGPRMVFFTLGNHHDLAIAEVGDDAPRADPRGVGLAHVAFKVGDSHEELAEMKRIVESKGATIDRAVDHGVTQSLYLSDPDGNGLELYVDVSPAWQDDPHEIVATYEKLEV